MKTSQLKIFDILKGSSKRRDYSTAFLPQKIRKTLNRHIIKQMKNNNKKNKTTT